MKKKPLSKDEILKTISESFRIPNGYIDAKLINDTPYGYLSDVLGKEELDADVNSDHLMSLCNIKGLLESYSVATVGLITGLVFGDYRLTPIRYKGHKELFYILKNDFSTRVYERVHKNIQICGVFCGAILRGTQSSEDYTVEQFKRFSLTSLTLDEIINHMTPPKYRDDVYVYVKNNVMTDIDKAEKIMNGTSPVNGHSDKFLYNNMIYKVDGGIFEFIEMIYFDRFDLQSDCELGVYINKVA
jgi:hypothetical protein